MSASAFHQIRFAAYLKAKDLAYAEAVAAMDSLTLFTDRKAIDRNYRAKIERINDAYEFRKATVALMGAVA